MKPLILFHSNCPDGAGAALAAWMKFRETAEYRPMSYNDPPIADSELKDRDVYVLDFSFKKDECLRIASIAKMLTLIDHHRTAMVDLSAITNMPDLVDRMVAGAMWTADYGNFHIRFDMNHSGAVLAWHHFHPSTDVPDLLRYIEDRDLWRWRLPHSKEINAALASYNLTSNFGGGQIFLSEWGADLERQLALEGRAILRAQEALIGLMVRGATPVSIGGSPALSVNASCLQSEVAHHLLNTPRVWPSGTPQPTGDPVAAIWFYDGAIDRYRVSLRSRPEGPDVSEIAKRYGGGGHRNAAGFERAELPWRDRSEAVAEAAGLYDEDEPDERATR